MKESDQVMYDLYELREREKKFFPKLVPGVDFPIAVTISPKARIGSESTLPVG